MLSRFDLTEKEKVALQEFLESLPQKYKYKKVKLIYSNGAGIGTCVAVKVGKLKKDITDVSCW